MSKIRLFLENFLVYGVGGIISKIIPVIMIPLITRLMPDTSSFGISDMCTTVVSFGSCLLYTSFLWEQIKEEGYYYGK